MFSLLVHTLLQSFLTSCAWEREGRKVEGESDGGEGGREGGRETERTEQEGEVLVYVYLF